MDRIRRSLRDSLRSRNYVPASARPHQWQSDEAAVKNNICSFHVKYLGCVQVYESRGMQVCEDALHLLRSQKRRPRRSTLFITGDGLRVVDAETKDLLVDQTIEKVSYCAPDRGDERGFSYICRDGTTRRWICHGFLAARDSGPDQLVTGERLSHAVGCAFTLCLERKQQREREKEQQEMERCREPQQQSYRPASIVERIADPQECKPAEPVPVRPVTNPFAVERPHAPATVLQRQGSLRAAGRLADASPFKRQSSLGVTDLLSAHERRAREPGVGVPALAEIPVFAPAPAAEEGNVTLLCRELGNALDALSAATPVSSRQSEPPPDGRSPTTPRPDDWLNALTNGRAAARPGTQYRQDRSLSLACDSLISSAWSQQRARAGTAGEAARPVPGGDTNPFKTAASVDRPNFGLKM